MAGGNLKEETTSGDPLVLTLNDDRARNPSLVGGKAANLAEILRLPGIQVPPAFVVTTAAYRLFLSEHPELARIIVELDDLTDEDRIRDSVEIIRQTIRTASVPHAVGAAIRQAHRILSSWLGPDELRVSVRSSATSEDSKTASFAGQYETRLNQKSPADVVASVLGVWGSTFGLNPVNYRNARRLKHSATEMAVVLMRMVDARAGGTAFTVDLETGAPMIRIHACHGLGEAEVRGSVTPDVWIVDPVSLTIMKRSFGEKLEKVSYDSILGQTVSGPTTADERARYALRCSEVRELARRVRCIGKHYRDSRNWKDMDVEYAVDDDGDIFVLQARPETAWGERMCRLVAVDLSRARDLPRWFMGGFTGSPGVAIGTLCVAGTLNEAERRIRPGDILVAANTTNLWERVLGLCSGAITDIGGPGSHTATVMREQGKAALTGAPSATAILKDHDGEVVTLDATQRIVFLGRVPDEWLFYPQTLRSTYGTVDKETEEESWDEATRTGQTCTGMDGRRWIGKPTHRVSRFMQEIYLACHKWIGDRLSAPVRAEIRDGIHWVDFHDLWQWRLRIRALTLEQLEGLHRERMATSKAYLDACDSFALTPDALLCWIRLFIRMNGFMGVAYNIFKVTEGWLEHELSGREIPEPYCSQVRPSIGALIGETEAMRELREYKSILEQTRRSNTRLRMVRNATGGGDLSVIRRMEPAFYGKLEKHAIHYKVVKNTDIARPLEESIRQLAGRLDRDVSQNREFSVAGTTAAEFYPEDERCGRIVRLTVGSEKARQDAHHLNYRGHWPVRKKLEPLAEWLARRGEVKYFSELFDHPPDWLLRQVIRYRMTRWLEDFLGQPCDVPPVPEEMSMERFEQLRSMGFDLFYLPPLGALSAESFRQWPGWRYPLDNLYWAAGMNGRTMLTGHWAAVEMMEAGQWPAEKDSSERCLDRPCRRSRRVSWAVLQETILPEVSKLLCMDRSRVRLLSAVEWNLLGNLLRHRTRIGDSAVDWGKRTEWEWTQDRNDCGQHVLVGKDGAAGLDGLVAVEWVEASQDRSAAFRFRVLAVL